MPAYKTCSCGALFDRDQWLALRFVGVQPVERGLQGELRECAACRSTISIAVISWWRRASTIAVLACVSYLIAWGLDRALHASALVVVCVVAVLVGAAVVEARALWLLTLVACGGVPFTLAQSESLAGPEGGADDAQGAADVAELPEAESGATDARTGSVDAGQGIDAADGGIASDAPHDSGIDVETSADTGPVCVTDLSGVGLGDWRVSFDVATTEIGYQALVNQASVCQQSCSGPNLPAEWDIYQLAGGQVSVATSGSVSVAANGPRINDGAVHHVEASRVGGMLSIAVDDVQMYPAVADDNAFGSLPPIVVGSDPCANGPGIAGCPAVPALQGKLTNMCLQR